MMDDDYSRREFLKKFAYLSSGALVLSVTTTACYGPMGAQQGYPMVSGIYFVNTDGSNGLLQNSQNVPLQTKFKIEFTDDMNFEAPASVFLTGPANTPVGCDNNVWETNRLLTVTPAQDLAPDTEYTLRVDDDAKDARGYNLWLTESATAVFKTVIG